jgi:hypothetical protein
MIGYIKLQLCEFDQAGLIYTTSVGVWTFPAHGKILI